MDNQNNVWIDRQEYERLKALEEQAPQTVVATNPLIGTSGSDAGVGTAEGAPGSSGSNFLTILIGVFAVGSFIYPPLIVIFLGLGLIGVMRFARSNATAKKKTVSSLAIGLVVGLSLVAAAPFIMIFGVIILWQLGCWTGLGSCRSV